MIDHNVPSLMTCHFYQLFKLTCTLCKHLFAGKCLNKVCLFVVATVSVKAAEIGGVSADSGGCQPAAAEGQWHNILDTNWCIYPLLITKIKHFGRATSENSSANGKC